MTGHFIVTFQFHTFKLVHKKQETTGKHRSGFTDTAILTNLQFCCFNKNIIIGWGREYIQFKSLLKIS